MDVNYVMPSKNLTHALCIKEPALSEMKEMIQESHDSILIIQQDIKYIRLALDGQSGTRGVLAKVEVHETFIDSIQAQIDLGKWLLGGGIGIAGLSGLLSLWQIFH